MLGVSCSSITVLHRRAYGPAYTSTISHASSCSCKMIASCYAGFRGPTLDFLEFCLAISIYVRPINACSVLLPINVLSSCSTILPPFISAEHQRISESGLFHCYNNEAFIVNGGQILLGLLCTGLWSSQLSGNSDGSASGRRANSFTM